MVHWTQLLLPRQLPRQQPRRHQPPSQLLIPSSRLAAETQHTSLRLPTPPVRRVRNAQGGRGARLAE